MRRDLLDLFETFVAQHRGVRLGKMFGAPAIYAGRKLGACLMDGGVVLKLPPAAADRVRRLGGKAWTPASGPAAGRTMSGWFLVVPKTAADATRLLPLLEVATTHAATAVNA